MIERVMLLDVVLDDGEYTWLGPAVDKRRFFVRRLGDRLSLDEYPRRFFGDGPAKCTRLFPDKLPIGVQPFAADPHVLVYLVTAGSSWPCLKGAASPGISIRPTCGSRPSSTG
jgi:hypothetical protein